MEHAELMLIMLAVWSIVPSPPREMMICGTIYQPQKAPFGKETIVLQERLASLEK